MIVRILGEGQLELDAGHLAELNELDDELAAAVAAADEPGFERALSRLLARVRELGAPMPADRIAVSELILPAAGSSLTEVQALLGAEGLIPG
ncbi:MAG TPA: hypothetical protein VMB79_05005 [Jatrophihabitans sp.]|nr:hypothetical protein [Jatrophihabitans sp.]